MSWNSLFAVYCIDGEHAKAYREGLLAEHLAYVENNIERYLVAGPLRSCSSGDHVGSLFVVRADDKNDLEVFMGGDPYYSSDLYRDVTINQFTAAAGSAIGGVIW